MCSVVSRRMSTRRGWGHASPSSGRLQKQPTITASPSSQTSGHSVFYSPRLSPMVAFHTQVRGHSCRGVKLKSVIWVFCYINIRINTVLVVHENMQDNI